MGNLSPEQAISGLRQLWKLAFGATAAFLDGFFGTAFSEPSLIEMACAFEKRMGTRVLPPLD